MPQKNNCPVQHNVKTERGRAIYILHAALGWAVTHDLDNYPPGTLERAAQEVYKRERKR